jgi:hypothetical protein
MGEVFEMRADLRQVVMKTFDVTSSGECSACSGENHAAHRRVFVHLGNSLQTLARHLCVHGVIGVWTVQGEGGDVVANVDDQRFVRHSYPSSNSPEC